MLKEYDLLDHNGTPQNAVKYGNKNHITYDGLIRTLIRMIFRRMNYKSYNGYSTIPKNIKLGLRTKLYNIRWYHKNVHPYDMKGL